MDDFKKKELVASYFDTVISLVEGAKELMKESDSAVHRRHLETLGPQISSLLDGLRRNGISLDEVTLKATGDKDALLHVFGEWISVDAEDQIPHSGKQHKTERPISRRHLGDLTSPGIEESGSFPELSEDARRTFVSLDQDGDDRVLH